jgi:hypothetical protein
MSVSGKAPPGERRADGKLVALGGRSRRSAARPKKSRRYTATAYAETWRSRPAEALLVFAIAMGARLMQLDHVPHKDELNHVLAARALLENGTLEIVPGGVPYTRVWGFTYLVAGLFRMFGESLVVARLPAVVAGAALVLLLFLWVRSEAGRVGAWFAALLLAFVPVSLQLSQWVRFYTPHALLFFAGCLLVYRLLSPPLPDRRRGIGLAAAAVLCFAIALHMHKLTVIGAAGLGLWVACVAPQLIGERFPKRRERVIIAAAATGAAVLVAALLVFSGYGRTLLRLAGHAPMWAQGRVDDVRFYHRIYLDLYGPLWTLFPLAALLALAARPKAALLAVCIFGLAFTTHSLLAWKQERYLFYALPFFFALWGMALGSALPWLKVRLRGLLRAGPARMLPDRAREFVATLMLVGVAAFAAFGTPAVSYGHKMLTVPDAEWRWGTYRGEPDWRAAAHFLGPQLADAEVVVGSHDVAAYHGLGRLDYLLRRVNSGPSVAGEMMLNDKIPVPVLSSPEALATVLSCHPRGLVIIERGHWRNPWIVTPAMVDLLEANTIPVPLPEGWRLVAYRWDSTGRVPNAEACAAYRRATQRF